MTPEEIQNILDTLKKSIESFAAQIGTIATGVEKPKTVQSVITTQDQGDSKEQTARLNDSIGPGDVKFIDALYKKFQPLLESLVPKTAAPANQSEDSASDTASGAGFIDYFNKQFQPILERFFPKTASPVNEKEDLADVLAGDETEKVTKVSVVGISSDVLKMLNGVTAPPTPEKGGGFLSGIMGLLGGVNATAAGGGILAMITALPAAIPGILTALGAIVLGAAALSLAIGIVVKTISLLKDDFIEIFPIIDKFAELFIKVAKEIIPVVYKALADFVATILPPLLDGLTTFASVVIPAIIGAIAELIGSPGFKFITGALVPVLSQIIDVISNLLSELIGGIKSIFTDTKDFLVSLFENIKQIVVPIINGIRDIIVAIAEPVKEVFISSFENIKEVVLAVLPVVSSAIDRIYDTFDNFIGKAKEILEGLPTILDKILNSIKDFANNVIIGRIGAVAVELTALGAALIGLTGGSLVASITNFFTGGGPFEKIIEFQNNLNESKLKLLENLAPSLQKLTDIDISQLKGLSTILNELMDQSLQVASTVEKIFAGKGIFNKSGGILELVDKLEKSKQGAENTISNVIIKTSEAQKQIAELHLKEAMITNKILSEIYKKMDAFADMPQKSNVTAKKPAGPLVDVTLPLQFTSNNTRQQIVQSGNSI